MGQKPLIQVTKSTVLYHKREGAENNENKAIQFDPFGGKRVK
jgi:hypothetical protein